MRWAIEFVRRDIWPDDTITVHGPHSPADFMWGEMGDYTFRTMPGIRGIHDVRGVRVSRLVYGYPQAFPLLATSALEPKKQRWLRTALRTLAKLRTSTLKGRKRT
jgi:hypothetical protein